MPFAPATFHAAWPILTRFGEASLLLPCGLMLAVWLGLRGAFAALAWLVPLAVAIALTALTKIAFIGFGIGSAALDFTGLSGHSVVAAAVHPVLASVLAAAWPRPWRAAAVASGYALALVVALSRYKLGLHSASECMLGFALGSVASALALRSPGRPQRTAVAPVAATLLGLWLSLALLPPLLPSHALVTWVALRLSGRDEPFTRAELHGPHCRWRCAEKESPRGVSREG